MSGYSYPRARERAQQAHQREGSYQGDDLSEHQYHYERASQQQHGRASSPEQDSRLQRERSFRSDRSFGTGTGDHSYRGEDREDPDRYNYEHSYPPEEVRAYRRDHKLAYDDPHAHSPRMESDIERYTSATTNSSHQHEYEKKHDGGRQGTDGSGEELVDADDPVIRTGADVSKCEFSAEAVDRDDLSSVLPRPLT